ncbi:lecithin retinol acyltransferase family protein [Paraburkholderia sp. BR13439]|uniref:lecithin retinol acyltransferase family protein n=1 Tax=Paraburkholderia TaxID=1822464 RepID=UPI0034CEF6A7
MNRNRHQSGTEYCAQRADAYTSIDVGLGGSNDEPALGAHLITQRHGYQHHGIYVGSGMVIHYAGFVKSVRRGPIEEVPLDQFADGHTVAVRRRPYPKYSGLQAVLRARSRLGEDRYRLLTNNCEHFCAWCLVGESRSEQIHAFLKHPGAGVHALLCLVSALIGIRIKTDRAAVTAA